jgi:hypothetical protein
MTDDQTTADVDMRVADGAHGADLTHVADALMLGRSHLLARRQAPAVRETFHADRPTLAITDHIPGIPGLGLGLYVCQGIVTAHGGTIATESDGVGRGAVITVFLPLLATEIDDPREDQ